jgi:hypothetical protein
MPYTTITINEQEITLNISSPSKSSQWGRGMDAWNVEVVHKGQKDKFKYFTGIGHRSDKKDFRTAKFDAQSFLYCIFSDASMIDQYGDDVDNFADDLGYTKVSEALKAFRGCTETHTKLNTLFGVHYDEISTFILENFG